MRILLNIIILFLPLEAQALLAPTKEMLLQCEQDAGCSAVESECWTRWNPVNKHFETWLMEQIEENRKIVRCKWRPDSPPKPVVRCVQGQCVIETIGEDK